MTPAKLQILQHALGLNKYGQGTKYRNRFVTGNGSDDYPICQQLTEIGAMVDTGTINDGRDHVFAVTTGGEVLIEVHSPKPPRLKRSQERYQDWLHADCGMSFIEWLKLRARL